MSPPFYKKYTACSGRGRSILGRAEKTLKSSVINGHLKHKLPPEDHNHVVQPSLNSKAGRFVLLSAFCSTSWIKKRVFLFINHLDLSCIPPGTWLQRHLAAGSPTGHSASCPAPTALHHGANPDSGPTPPSPAPPVSYLSLCEMQSCSQVNSLRAHHVLLLEELLLQPLQLLWFEDRADPLHLAGPAGPPRHSGAQRAGPYTVRQLQTCKQEAAIEGVCMLEAIPPALSRCQAQLALVAAKIQTQLLYALKGAGRR